MTYDELYEKVKSGEIVGAILAREYRGMKKVRFFISTDGHLCIFNPRSSRRGTYFPMAPAMIESTFGKPPAIDKDLATYRKIAKYRKMAFAATFTNNFIADCRALPASFEEWVAQGKKDLYKSGITTGNRIDAKVISLKSLAKKQPIVAENFKRAMETRTSYHSHRFSFRGYDSSVSLEVYADGSINGFLSLEFKGCGNGYYYLLVNDENFIGYDID